MWRNTVKNSLSVVSAPCMESIKQQTFKESFVITADKGGNTMVWTWEVPTPAGNTQKNSIQVTRKLD